MGYTIIAAPPGIVSVEIADATRKKVTIEVRPHCLKEGHGSDAVYCKSCGEKL